MPRSAPSPGRAVCAGLLLAIACAATAQDLPSRKPGLWEITMQTTNAPSQSMRQCIDEKTDRQMQQMTQGQGVQQCTKNVIRREGDTYVGESECRFGPTVATSRSTFGGDFGKSYRGEIETRYAPPMAGVSLSKVTMNARWSGACPTGWKAGDMEMTGMGRVNVNEVMAGAAKGK